MWRFRGMSGAMGREKAATQTAQEKPREQAELHVASANGSANRTRKGGEQAELQFASASGSANRMRKSFRRRRGAHGKSVAGIKKKSTATDARCLRKAISQRRQRKPHGKNRANRQNYISLPPVAAQTAREKATQTARKKTREQAELHVASASGSTNRTRKGSTSCTGKKKRGRV